MRMKTSDLSGTALDCAVFEAEYGKPYEFTNAYKPSEDWAQGGPIIERERIQIQKHLSGWVALPEGAEFSEENHQEGETPLIAAMRCYVASKLGDEMEIPIELKSCV